MAGEHQDMEEWGVYSIFKEAGRLLYQHIRILRPFILAFRLPVALILFLEVIGIASFLTWVADHLQPHHVGGIFGHHHRHSDFHAFHADFFKAPIPPEPILIFVLELILLIYTLTFLIITIEWLLASLAAAGIAKAIHHIYSSNNTSHNEDSNSSHTQTETQIQSIFTSLPHSLYRIFTVSLCFFVVDILTYFLHTLPFYLLSGPKFASYWVWQLVFLILNFWFGVSVQVAVLESHYGWAALQRSAKLVKAKAVTALGLLIAYFVYLWVFDLVLQQAIIVTAHSVVLYVLAGALAVGYLAFGTFGVVVMTVFYFVSKSKCAGGEEGHQAERNPLIP